MLTEYVPCTCHYARYWEWVLNNTYTAPLFVKLAHSLVKETGIQRNLINEHGILNVQSTLKEEDEGLWQSGTEVTYF